jgi:predicted nuclease of restriction endonuclease-like (RecB) superfamily
VATRAGTAPSTNGRLVRRGGAAPDHVSPRLLADLRTLIDDARESAARAVNTVLVRLCWTIGKRVREDVLKQKRAEYGERIVQALAARLTAEYGRGFGRHNLSRMIHFAEVFPNEAIVATLSQQLSWSHFVMLLPMTDSLQRDFYAEMCRVERWSTRALRQKIDGMLFERTAISRKPAALARKELAALRDEDRLTPDLVFRDPYVLDFLGLKDTYVEKDLESAILRELEAVVVELGEGFAFVARQKRITVDGQDYYLDLLFYHRGLRRLVAVDLKLGRFRAADKGQMELYLRWLDRHERRSGEDSPLGLVLCADKSDEHVELLRLDDAGIRVSTYFTDLPSRKLLERKLHDAVRSARARLGRRRESRKAVPGESP